MIILSLLAASAAAALIVMLLIAGLNAITFPRLHPPQPDRSRPLIVPSAATPLVSILIPARDEATAIGATVRSLLAQTYAPFEVLILDDSSADGTGEIARRAAAGDPRFQVIAGEPLLAGWVGESWACHQLSLRAQGSVLIFAAADVQWQPEGLAALIAELQRTQADLLTVWATPITVTRGERLIVPLTALARFADLPALLVQHRSSATFAAATGQCLAFRRSAYQALGGHICVRDAALADLSFARQIKARGLRLRLADGAGLITCRRYRRWHDLRAGFADNLLAAYGNHVTLLGLSTLFHLAIFVLPALWLLIGWLLPPSDSYPLVPLALTLMGISLRALTAAATHQRWYDAIWLPISALLLTWIALSAIWSQWRKRRA